MDFDWAIQTHSDLHHCILALAARSLYGNCPAEVICTLDQIIFLDRRNGSAVFLGLYDVVCSPVFSVASTEHLDLC